MKDYLGQRLDWLGINYYTRFVIKGRKSLLAKIFAGIPTIPEIVQNYGFVCQPNSKSVDVMPTSELGWRFFQKVCLKP